MKQEKMHWSEKFLVGVTVSLLAFLVFMMYWLHVNEPKYVCPYPLSEDCVRDRAGMFDKE